MLQENDYMSLERGITYPHLNYTFPLFDNYTIFILAFFEKLWQKLYIEKLAFTTSTRNLYLHCL